MNTPPQFNAQPVIVVHLSDGAEGGRPLAACCGEPYVTDIGEQYRHIPRVLCTGCLAAPGRQLSERQRADIAAGARTSTIPADIDAHFAARPPSALAQALLDAQRERGGR